MKELDEVRQEEEKKLAEVESKIDSIASGYEQKTQKLNEYRKIPCPIHLIDQQNNWNRGYSVDFG